MRYLWITVFSGVLIWSGIGPKDYLTWALEVFPAVIGILLIGVTWNKFRLTPLLYALILLHSIVLMVGGHYTYAEVPLFDDIKPLFGFERNNYDKVGHLMQGITPAILTREIIIRRQLISGPGWRKFFILSVCLAVSALYELIEWVIALISGASADAFLATQGFAWDTQTDMAFALLGAIAALLLLSRVHDRQLKTISK
jgi:putative membrane protein